MKRIIEELIEKRKAKQEKLEKRLGELAESIGKGNLFGGRKKEIGEKFAALGTDFADFVTAQDREWDAYAGNHATQVFKSLEWKIERLENEYSNLHTLLARFVGLERALDRLIESAGGKRTAKRSDSSVRSRKSYRSSSTPGSRTASAAMRTRSAAS